MARRESNVSFTLPPSSLFSLSSYAQSEAAFSDSESSIFSAATSPSSSLASSPALRPSASGSPVADELCLADTKPSPRQVTAYAASIIRAEAYALLALADRMTPSSSPCLDDLDAPFSPDFITPSSSSRSLSPVEESRTNNGFLNTLNSLAALPPHGKILVTGVGKSGIAGRKIVATLCSLGIPAAFLHPLEALHGDLGCVCPCSPHNPCDAAILISHSGATAELMRLLPILRPRVRTLVAVTRDPESVLARACHHWLDAGTGTGTGLGAAVKDGEKVTDEADSALPAPTSSVVTALAIGDALALSLSRVRLGWDKDGKARRADFLRCHPGGQLGIELGREGRGVPEATAPVV
ncbi:SIS domain-containing protein [Meredithblackwellia eburnea MCA 4105]